MATRINLRVPVFGLRLIVHVGDEDAREKYIKEVQKLYEVTHTPDLSTSSGNSFGSLIWIKEPDISTLAHELCHFADASLDHLGIDDTSGEVRAYLVGYCMDKLKDRIHG